jgi:hypothetical protein
MKRYYYHVAYYKKGKKSLGVGDIVVDTPEHIKTSGHINAVRRTIAADCEDEVTALVILGWQLPRIEDAEPEEVATPWPNWRKRSRRSSADW